ncbi:MAG: MurR/RpiR family transcriptional regulator [Niameybacter sp.]|nr:MurR/RpiR family transcriptional regulator [Niameybacter sp.]
MNGYEKTVIPRIEAFYDQLTNVEKIIADFFIHNDKKMDFSSKNIASYLYVSEASLSRFAKKCGFKGYREFLFHYEETFYEKKKVFGTLTQSVLDMYGELLSKSFTLVNEAQMDHISEMLSSSKHIYIYGKGSSGLAGREMKLRFMRLGLYVEAIDDAHIMKMNSALVDESALVIGISISGKTEEVLFSLKLAHEKGAKCVLISSHYNEEVKAYCNEILLVSGTYNLERGDIISPQFPILVMVDIFYAYFLNTDFYAKSQLLQSTLSVLKEDKK